MNLSLLYLALLFVTTIVSIVMVGILFTQLVEKNQKKATSYFLVFFFVFLAKSMINVYLAFAQDIVFTKLNLVFDLLPLAIAITTAVILKEKKKKIALPLYTSIGLLLLTDILFFFTYNELLGILNILGLLIFYVSFYFLTIKHLTRIT